jgi:quercetin dioxygenase-like cupin family protein
MIVLQNDALEFIASPGGNASAAVATPSRRAREVSVIRQRQQPGGHNPPHTHDREEVIVVLRGQVGVTIGSEDAEASLAEGDAVIIPAGAPHQIANRGADPAEWLLIATAGVRFFHNDGTEGTPPWSL